MESLNINCQWLGAVDYEAGLKLQVEEADFVREAAAIGLAHECGVILGCEHPTVITLGKRGQPLEDLLTSMENLRKVGIKIVATDRGGQATLHNPGQLVLYPILPIRQWGLGVREYVECLERATAHFLAEFGMDVVRGYEPGLYVESQKIAAFGIRVDRGVTLHGTAINIYNDVSQFQMIRQCGQTLPATSLEQEMKKFMGEIPPWDMGALALKWTDLLKNELNEVGPRPLPLDEPTTNPLQI